jgi:hypothetical protein
MFGAGSGHQFCEPQSDPGAGANRQRLLNWTVLLHWLGPKPTPFKVTVAPSSAAGGDRLLMTGLTRVKSTTTGLEIEFTVTMTGPVPAEVALDTVATICVLVQLVTDAAGVPLNLTVLVP